MADNQRDKSGQPNQEGGQGDQKQQGGGARGQGSEQTQGEPSLCPVRRITAAEPNRQTSLGGPE